VPPPARSFDVVVIGGGIAGAAAALKAAEEGARVAVVKSGGGASVHASGAVDVCPDPRRAPPAGAAAPSLRELLKAFIAERPGHPYAVLSGGDALALERAIDEAARALFRDLDEEGLLYRGSLARNLVVPTPGGRWRECAWAQDAIASADLAALSRARLAVVAVGPAAAARAAAQAAELRRGVEARGFPGLREVTPCPIEAPPRCPGVPGEADASSPLEPAVARALDDEAACAAWANEVAAALARHAPQATHALFPPLLGLDHPAVAVAILARESGRAPLETVGLPPSVPGLRLERALARVLERRKVALVRGRALEARAQQGVLRSLAVEAREGTESLEAGAFVLAGGRYLGGALREGNRVAEPLFDLPLFAGARALAEVPLEERCERRIGGDHALLRAGVKTGADLRPLARTGAPAFENLFAAGATLAGWSFSHDRTGIGVALASGRAAGARAALAAAEAREAVA
jgi:glycerol-3-phosphate dehydrogenase subunit B